jgi:hypothetical protein
VAAPLVAIPPAAPTRAQVVATAIIPIQFLRLIEVLPSWFLRPASLRAWNQLRGAA